MDYTAQVHIENRRLFEAAAGISNLEVWEREHLHTCEVCQGVFYVFVSQRISYPSPASGDPSAA